MPDNPALDTKDWTRLEDAWEVYCDYGSPDSEYRERLENLYHGEKRKRSQNGTIVGFDLPFDIARIAITSSPARGHMRGGFTHQIADDDFAPCPSVPRCLVWL